MSTHCLSLIAASGAADVGDAAIASARTAFADAGEPAWLSPRRACELPVSVYNAGAQHESLLRLRADLEQARIDVNLLPPEGRRKRLLIADMDSTIVEQETLDELADVVGRKAEVAAITEQAMRGELDFRAALRARIALIAGTPASVIDEVARRIRHVPGGATLIAVMRAHGAFTALVSGGFSELVGRVAGLLGFDAFQANRFLVRDERIVGVAEPILDKQAKLQALGDYTAARGLTPADALAVGDGANDVPMLQAAGMGVAFRAKPAVRAAVPVQICHADLTALLYLQGYSDLDISRWAAADITAAQ
jgi:phosphoserine phosphatase